MFKIVCDGCGAEVSPSGVNLLGDPITPQGWTVRIDTKTSRYRIFHACSAKCQDKIDENYLWHEKIQQ